MVVLGLWWKGTRKDFKEKVTVEVNLDTGMDSHGRQGILGR